ncbi:hypothetical protein [Iamia sp.]|uniref:hypothetical protein n=1 Tax=Iamia sp. TaxID=2722710 RepID=UPI002C8437F9|nr:hypothetical protein [Iamia sp.]HXH58500.1 hypothetical protein [Iamia sp.]
MHAAGPRPAPAPRLAISNALGTLVSQDDDPARTRATVIPIWEHLLRSLKVPE